MFKKNIAYRVFSEKGKIMNEQVSRIELGTRQDVEAALVSVQGNINYYSEQIKQINTTLENLQKEEKALLEYLEKEDSIKSL